MIHRKVSVSEKGYMTAKEKSASHVRKFNYSQHVNPMVDHILFLQRNVGNRAVGRMITRSCISGINYSDADRFSIAQSPRHEISKTSALIQREIWDLTGPDAASCKDKIAEDTAVCSDHANTACTAGGATIAGTGALLGAGIGAMVTGPAAPAGALIGGLVGFGAGIVGGIYGYGKCMEVANAKCRALGRQKSQECDKQFAQPQPSAPIPEVNVEELPKAPEVIPEVNVEDLPEAK